MSTESNGKSDYQTRLDHAKIDEARLEAEKELKERKKNRFFTGVKAAAGIGKTCFAIITCNIIETFGL